MSTIGDLSVFGERHVPIFHTPQGWEAKWKL